MSERDKDKLIGWMVGLVTVAIIWLASSTIANASDLAVTKQRCGFVEDRLERMEKKMDTLLQRVPATNP
jgi:hypothetical protein